MTTQHRGSSCLRIWPWFAAVLLGAACASAPQVPAPASALAPHHWDYFGAPEQRDPWSLPIQRWQQRSAAAPHPVDAAAPSVASHIQAMAGAAPPANLGLRYALFRRLQRRALALSVADWVRAQSLDFFVPDRGPEFWLTLDEVLEAGGDDCDGLELLTFYLLRDLGFREGELYRAVMRRERDQQHHMVTLWFENRDDPWVIDPTGAMTDGLPRLSEVPGWRPLKVFSETEEFTPRAR